MISRFAMGSAALACLWSTVLHAQPVPTAADVNSIPLDRLCRADGAHDLRFGEKGPPVKQIGLPRPVIVKLGDEFGPFREVSLGLSRYSNAFVWASYEISFADQDQAKIAADAIGARLISGKWYLQSGADDSGLGAQYVYSSAALVADAPAPDETTFTIALLGNHMTLTCENAVQAQVGFDEASGRMPVGTARPQLADYVVPQSGFTVADCDDAAKREAFQREMDERGQAAFSPNWARKAYEEDLAYWKIMKLTSSGKTDFDSVSNHIVSLMDNPDTLAAFEGGLATLEEFGAEIEKLDPQDEAGMCRAMHKVIVRASALAAPKPGALDDAVTPQWQATHEWLDKEAKRLGVSFDG
jgi:hypothetical protein